MRPIFTSTVTLALVFAGVLPAANSNLVNLVMPDATVIAGVNVAQARNTPFGQYVLSLMAPNNSQIQALTVLTGFDPRQDVNELLVATSGGPKSKTGLVLALGTFNVSAIATAAAAAGAAQLPYNGVTILVSPNAEAGVAFLNSSLAAMGDLASVQGAIDRQTRGAHLSQSVISQINQLSGVNDAWVLTTVPVSTLALPAGAPEVKGLNLQSLQSIQQASAAVKFGASVMVAAQAQLDTAQNATTLAGMVQFLANMAALQAQKSPEAAVLAKSVTAGASGTTVSVSFSLPAAVLQQLVAADARKVSKK